MASLNESLADRSNPVRLLFGAVVFILGVGLAGIGTYSATLGALAPALSPAAAVNVSLSLTGAVLIAVLLVAIRVFDAQADSRRIAAGVLLAAAGVASVWAVVPAEPVLVAPLAIPAITFATGAALLVSAVFEGAIDAQTGTTAMPSVDLRPNRSPGRTYADGGDDDDSLDFLLDEK